MRCDPDQFERLVADAVAQVPEHLRGYLDNIVIEVQDLPDRDTLRRTGLRSRRDLLGLYVGIPLTGRSVALSGNLPDKIVIYQANIERLCRTEAQIVEQVRRTVLHEIGHHFGLDEDDLAEHGYG